MPKSYTQLFYHLIWATWKRHPLIEPDIQDDLYRYIGHKCKEYGYQAHAINGMEEHIHVVIRLPATVTIADVVGKLKGSSSRFLTKHFGVAFKWQAGYGAMTFGKRDLDKVVEYVENQKVRHRERRLNPLLESDEGDESMDV